MSNQGYKDDEFERTRSTIAAIMAKVNEAENYERPREHRNARNKNLRMLVQVITKRPKALMMELIAKLPEDSEFVKIFNNGDQNYTKLEKQAMVNQLSTALKAFDNPWFSATDD